MNEYQKLFLFYVFIYYVFKGGILVASYFAIKLMMKKALQRHEQYKLLYMKKRAEEEERWKGAHSSNDPAILKPVDLAELVTNPKSFTAYSNVGKRYLNLGYRHRMFANG